MGVMRAEGTQRFETLGEFRLESVLGTGGSGTVYAASSPRFAEVALKVLRGDLALSERERRRFFEEVEAMRRVSHPSLVRLVDAGTFPDGRPYLCMPLLRGETAAARVERGRLPVDLALSYFGSLAEGVAAMHDAGLVHRDIKPENVFLTEGVAVLLDFGIAREIDQPATTTTRAGGLRGTPAYMAPERFFGTPASIATDVYELAVVFYVMLVGALPWEADAAEARLNPQPPKDKGVDLPSTLSTTLMRALSTRPDARPRSAHAFSTAVREALDATAPARVTKSQPPFVAAASTPTSTPTEPKFEPKVGSLMGGRYRLDRLLGEGGMGEVWAATHVVTQRVVALKLLRWSLARDERYRRRFVREARAASRVSHPNVIEIHDILENPGETPTLVMDLLEGESLRDRLKRQGALSLDETIRILRPAIAAVATAHERGVVHRDLKPENIFIARVPAGTRVVVLDFGIAKLSALEGVPAHTATLTTDGSMLGTPYYMSPEQVYGEDVDHRTDVWSLGVILYECLAGRRPTQAGSLGQILKIITHHEIVPIDKIVPQLPHEVSTLVMGMLAADRDDRPDSLAQVARVLGDDTVRRSPGRMARLLWRRGRRAQTLAVGSTALVVIALGFVASARFAGGNVKPAAGVAPVEPLAPSTSTWAKLVAPPMDEPSPPSLSFQSLTVGAPMAPSASTASATARTNMQKLPPPKHVPAPSPPPAPKPSANPFDSQ
jgi:serine/threonine-protein kinase